MNETLKPETQIASPEQEVVADMSATVKDALDAQGVVPQTLDDGSTVRKVKVVPHFGPSLTETTSPEGVVSYEYASLYSQLDDRGEVTSRWEEGGSSVNQTAKMELGGESSKVIEDELGMTLIKNNVRYAATQLPEKAIKQKSRLSRALGRVAHRG